MFCTDRQYSLEDARDKKKVQNEAKKAIAAEPIYIESKGQFCPVKGDTFYLLCSVKAFSPPRLLFPGALSYQATLLLSTNPHSVVEGGLAAVMNFEFNPHVPSAGQRPVVGANRRKKEVSVCWVFPGIISELLMTFPPASEVGVTKPTPWPRWQAAWAATL